MYNLLASYTRSTIEVNSTDGEDTTIEPLISTTKSMLIQADIVMWENILLYPKDATDIGVADPLFEIDEDDKS